MFKIEFSSKTLRKSLRCVLLKPNHIHELKNRHTFDSLRLSTWFNNWLVTAAGVVAAAAFFCSFKNIQILNRTQSTDPFLFTLTTNLLFNFSTIWHRFESYIVAPHHLIFKFPRQVVSLKLLQRPEKKS